jgi:hypothetical protein
MNDKNMCIIQMVIYPYAKKCANGSKVNLNYSF